MYDNSDDNWGRWGASDEIGAPNLVDPAKILDAVALVTQGRIISLAQPIGPTAGVPPHRNKGSRFMDRDAGDYALGARSPGGFRFAEDTVQLSTHSGTHMDALAHAWEGDELYNGHSSANVRSTLGAKKLGADKLRPGVTRGVLLDFVSINGVSLPPSTPIGPVELVDAYQRAKVTPAPGDAVLLRTGWWESTGSSAEYFDLEPGLSNNGARWLSDRDVAYVGADNYAVEVQPDPDGATFPVHLRLIHKFGVPLIENLDLAELAAAGASTFLLVLAPVGFQGSTGSPLNPLAVL
ncbi:cyclase family protein [Cryobacterium sp. M15]|uniref:cyclase family protein n=1 Tax=Cryobacterium sp. M15 TaxID=2048291 RepID=UPI000CE3B146|nr:cyclase family protein [Cryobacterium sp. M15]